jgi:hypothetical protein
MFWSSECPIEYSVSVEYSSEISFLAALFRVIYHPFRISPALLIVDKPASALKISVFRLLLAVDGGASEE